MERTAQSRVQPSAWELEVESMRGPGWTGHGVAAVRLSGGLGHDLDLRDGPRPLADGGAHAVGAGVATADDDDVLARGQDGLVVRDDVTGHAAVGLAQEVHGEVDAR